MKRREFVKNTALAISLPFWLKGCQYLSSGDYPVYFHSDHHSGHLLMKSREWRRKNIGFTQTIVIGGGIAGISAASGLGHANFKLFELSDRLGGSSGVGQYDNMIFSQGAHYELAYPDYYGEEVLQLFEQLDIIHYQPWKKMWSFTDRQHIIPFSRRQQCYQDGKMRSEVIPDGIQKDQFYGLLGAYSGNMYLPTRLIPKHLHHLNDLTFTSFLSQRMELSPELHRQLDYHMMDDWGGPANHVSALAGIHYFMCRPYLTKSVDLFSPPEGNYYFLNRIASTLPQENLITNHLVSKIEQRDHSFLVEILDIQGKIVKLLTADNIVYAGQKHALKYIYEKEAHLFYQEQAPWMVMNFVCEGKRGKYGFWQNEFLGENRAFLGFIDSSMQHQSARPNKRILTAYYCLEPSDRAYLTTVQDHREKIASETIGNISEMLQEKIHVEACFINVMGHAMSIPGKGFLFNDANDKSPDLIYAGVDNGRLPLLYEAVDSGLMAAQLATQ